MIFFWLALQPYFLTYGSFVEVKVVVVFDAMLSGLPNHKESFAGYVNMYEPLLYDVLYEILYF